ncbi:MAG: hypothetical protein RR047_02485 [Bacilli bacterium]
MNKLGMFKTELGMLKNQNYLEDYKYLIEHLPDYFFVIPAASTGKYHPSYTVGDGGLVRHTKAAVKIAYDLLDNPSIGSKYTSAEQDLMLIALTIHDGFKSGVVKGQYTVTEHPLLVGEYIRNNKDNLHFTASEIDFLCKVIASHMGPWNTDYKGNVVLPKPTTKYESFVHMCDYLASRKAILFKFDEDGQIVE